MHFYLVEGSGKLVFPYEFSPLAKETLQVALTFIKLHIHGNDDDDDDDGSESCTRMTPINFHPH